MAFCRNIQNNDIYQYLGNDEYLNVRTGVKGKLEPELAQKVLKINLEATSLLSEYPLLLELIKRLELKMDR